MAGATLTTLASILKDYYLPTVAEQLNNEVLMLQRLEPSAQDLFGNQAVLAIHKGRSGGIGPALENGALPAAGNQQYARAVYNLIYLYGRIGVTGPGMAKTASAAGSYLQMLKSELDGVRTDLMKDLARQVYGSGLGNGLIAQCGTTTASNTVVLGSSEALRKGHIYIGMVVDIGTAPGATSVATARNVTDVNVTNGTITIDGATVTTSSSHYVARSGAGGNEITGISDIVTTSTSSVTVGGIDGTAAGNSWWDNLRMTNGGTPRALSLTLLNQAFNQVRVKGGDVSLMVSSFGQQRALFELLQAQVRYTDPTNLKGGFTALDYQGRPFVGDVDHPFGRINVLTEKHLRVFSNRDWHFLDEDGDVLKWKPGFDAYEAVLARYINLGVARRNVQLVLGDLTDTTGF